MTTVVAAGPDDVEELAALLEEMDRFYGATDAEPLDERIRQIEAAIFTADPVAYALLAWEAGQLVGFATYSFLWPAIGLTRSLYLKELYVTEPRRRSGVGTALMRAVFDVAVRKSCSRVEWTADMDNPEAQRFYQALARPHPSKLFYRLEGDDLRRAWGR